MSTQPKFVARSRASSATVVESERPLIVHVLLLAAVVLVILVLRDPYAGFTSDDGVYGGQIRALEDGSWALERPLPVVSADNEGWVNTAVLPEGPIPSPRHPGYVALLVFASKLFGEPIGIHLVGAVGTVLAAVLAWMVARSIDNRAGPAAFWIAALSPQLINSTALWAHSLSAAIAGVAIWAMIQVHRKGIRPSLLLILATASSAGVMLRSEAVLLVIAMAFGAVLVRHRPLIVATAAASVASLVAFFVDRAWRIQITGRSVELEPSAVSEPATGWLATRIPAAWHILVGVSADPGAADLAALIGLVCALVGAFHLRDPKTQRQGLIVLSASVAAYAMRLLLLDSELITGLVTAWPMVLVVLVAGRRHEQTRLLIVIAIAFSVLVLATQHANSGGTEWGGRYLSPLTVPLAVIAAIHGRTLIRQWPLLMLVLLTLPTASGVLASHRTAAQVHRVLSWVDQVESEVVIAQEDALPRFAWRSAPEVSWYRAQPQTVEQLVVDLSAAGVHSIRVQGFTETKLDTVGNYRSDEIAPGLRLLTRPSGGD